MKNIIGDKGFVSYSTLSPKDLTIETDVNIVSGSNLYIGDINVLSLTGSGGGGGSPGGSDTQLQYNNAGTFNGVSTATFSNGIFVATGSFSGSFAGNLIGETTSLSGSIGLVKTLTYDPTSPSTQTVFSSFSDLWTAYEQTTGAVRLFFTQGTSLPTGLFQLRKGSTIEGVYNQYDPSVTLLVSVGTQLLDWNNLTNITIESNSDNYVLTYSENYPSIYLDHSKFRSNGSSPMILWSLPQSSGFLNFGLENRSNWENVTQPVIDIQGLNGSGDKAGVSIAVAKNCIVGANTFISNTDAVMQITVLDGTANISLDQPGYLGENSPLDSTDVLSIDFKVGLNVKNSFNITNPSAGDAPGFLQLVNGCQTTDDTPTPVFPVQTVPPIISAGLDLRILAREAATGDSAFWIIKALVKFDGSGASVGPMGFVEEFYDASLGATSWGYNFVLNDPDPNNVQVLVIGELGKTIQWSISIVEMLVIAF